MFCVMDVSGSMDQDRKDLAKRFFILPYLFLTRHYEKIDIVFIRHHTQAAEVSEDEFFHSQESGGTVVSSALVLLDEIIRARYTGGDSNIYVAQASDGDNFDSGGVNCRNLLAEKILPLVRYSHCKKIATFSRRTSNAARRSSGISIMRSNVFKKASWNAQVRIETAIRPYSRAMAVANYRKIKAEALSNSNDSTPQRLCLFN